MPIPVIITGYPQGGSSCFHLASAATTNATIVKAGSGLITSWYITNTNAAIRYIVFHDQANGPTAGQKVARKYGIPASGASNVSFPIGLQFNYGIAITTVTGAADNDATAVAANDLIINIEYV